ncbi:DUF1294 domain-containing protein [Aquabacterium sp.]|uniref:DUF1294 domain-containing protein n=1 Tax=Aquabacterium sp. TaxID=1872578 RepID=UPI0035C67F80
MVRWEADRGFGFIRSPHTDADVFFHVRDFRGPGRPQPGMAVRYEEIHVGGKGPRAMAVSAVQPTEQRRQTADAPGRLDARADARSGVRSNARPGPRRAAPSDPWLGPVLLAAVVWALALAWATASGRIPRWAVPAWIALNLWTFAAYWRDKWAAQRGQWRTPENTLHLWSLLGGWPMARMAQQVLRHKSAKADFQRAYWLTVTLHVAAVTGWVALSVRTGLP